MSEIIINNIPVTVKEYQGQRVVTFKDIDTVHDRPEGTARKRFNDNKKHFIEGEDFYKTKLDEVRPFFGQTPPNGFNPKADIILITETGYLMLVKSFTDDLAWDIQRQLVNNYFNVKENDIEVSQEHGVIEIILSNKIGVENDNYNLNLNNRLTILEGLVQRGLDYLRDRVDRIDSKLIELGTMINNKDSNSSKSKMYYNRDGYLWKKNIVAPLIAKLKSISGLDDMEIYSHIYSEMSNYGFDKEYVKLSFCKSHNLDNALIIDAIAESLDYRELFIDIVNSLIIYYA